MQRLRGLRQQACIAWQPPWDCDARRTTSHEDLGSGGPHISGAQAAGRRLAGLYRKTQYHPRIKSEGVALSNTRFVQAIRALSKGASARIALFAVVVLVSLVALLRAGI